MKKIEAEVDTTSKHFFVSVLYFGWPNQPSLKEAILADKNVLNEITDEFVDEFIGVIHDVYHTKMTATDKKAVLLISWSSSWEFVI